MSKPSTHWSERAACLGLDPDLFFPDAANAVVSVREARKTCARCTVALECHAQELRAVEYNECADIPFGVVAGMSASER